jgi:hypothetical protein
MYQGRFKVEWSWSSCDPSVRVAVNRRSTVGRFWYLCWRILLPAAGAKCHHHDDHLHDDDELDHINDMVYFDIGGSDCSDNSRVYDQQEHGNGDG